ncbi:MAG TPA: hypothetical protein VFC02_27920 [Anaerolineales bacterium]|nr:hypothetical protein [Anaerolineales bacterium]
MFPNDSCGCFGKCPQHETEPSTLCLSFPAEIIERLLHGITQPLPELSWIESKEFLLKSMNYVLVIHHI